MSVKEKDFTYEVGRGARWLRKSGVPVAYRKMPDMPRGDKTRFSVDKGYDAFLVYAGQHHALEFKLTKTMSVSLSALNEQQEDALQEVVAAGGSGWVVVNFRTVFSEREKKKRGTARTIEAFAVPIGEWIQQRSEGLQASLHLDWMREHAVSLQRVHIDGQAGWDLRPILGATSGLAIEPELVGSEAA